MTDVVDFTPPAFLEKVRLTERNEYEYALSVWRSSHPRWCRWLESKGIEPAELVPRTKTRGQIQKHFANQNLAAEFKEWRKEIKKEMLALDYNKKVLGRGAANELSYWLAPLVDLKPAPKVRVAASKVEITGTEYLPEEMRWVAHHPGLTYANDEEMSDTERAQARKYVQVHKCPSQYALNMFRTYRGDSKEIMAFFKECVRLHYESRKKKEEKPPEDQEQVEALEQVEDLWSRMGKKAEE